MKNSLRLLLLTGGLLPFATAPARAAEPRPPTLVERYALDYLKAHETEDQLDAELTKLGLAAGSRHDDVVAAVKAMRAALKIGAKPDSVAFWDEVADQLKGAPKPVAPVPATATTKPAETPAVPTAVQVSSAAQALWEKGRAAIAAMPPAERDVYLHYNLRDVDRSEQPYPHSASKQPETAGQSDIPTFAKLAYSPRPPDPSRSPDNSSLDYKADQLLVRVGYDKVVAAAKAAGGAPSAEQTEAVNKFGAVVADTPPAQDADTLLRKRGIAFTAGVGVILGRAHAGDSGVGTLMARWNWVQQHATALWNQKIGANNPDGDTLVSYYGQIEYARPNRWRSYRLNPYAERDTSGFLNMISNPSFFGPFFGSVIAGDRIQVPGGVAGEKERPYLAGLGIGFSYYREAASLVYLDWGWTVSPSKGFKGSSNYVGLSFDGVVLEKIFQGIRGRKSPVAP